VSHTPIPPRLTLPALWAAGQPGGRVPGQPASGRQRLPTEQRRLTYPFGWPFGWPGVAADPCVPEVPCDCPPMFGQL